MTMHWNSESMGVTGNLQTTWKLCRALRARLPVLERAGKRPETPHPLVTQMAKALTGNASDRPLRLHYPP